MVDRIMATIKNNPGKIITAPGINLWEQEYETVQALVQAG